jgi:hypothetical protein
MLTEPFAANIARLLERSIQDAESSTATGLEPSHDGARGAIGLANSA